MNKNKRILLTLLGLLVGDFAKKEDHGGDCHCTWKKGYHYNQDSKSLLTKRQIKKFDKFK